MNTTVEPPLANSGYCQEPLEDNNPSSRIPPRPYGEETFCRGNQQPVPSLEREYCNEEGFFCVNSLNTTLLPSLRPSGANDSETYDIAYAECIPAANLPSNNPCSYSLTGRIWDACKRLVFLQEEDPCSCLGYNPCTPDVSTTNATMAPTLEPSISTAIFNQTESTSITLMSMMTTASPVLTPTLSITLEKSKRPTNTSMDPTTQLSIHATISRTLEPMPTMTSVNSSVTSTPSAILEETELPTNKATMTPNLELSTSTAIFNQTESTSTTLMSMMTTASPVLTPTLSITLEESKHPTNTSMDPTTQLSIHATMSRTLEPMSTMTSVNSPVTSTLSAIPEETELPTKNEDDNRPFYYAVGAGAVFLVCACLSTICCAYRYITKRKSKSRNDQDETISSQIELLPFVEQGNADAQYNLAMCYKKGEGVPKDLTKAAYWFEKAAKQGNAFAQNNLGMCYKKGEGVPKDPKKAAYWCKKAAKQVLLEK